MFIFALLFSSLVFADSNPMKVIDPTGDENLGIFEVQLPQLDSKESYLHSLAMHFDGPDGKRILVAKESKIRSLAGDACFKTAQHVGRSTIESQECNIKISSGKTTLMALAAVRLVYNRTLVKTDFGKPIQFFMNGYKMVAAEMPKSQEYFAFVPNPVNVSLGVDNQALTPEWKSSLIPGQKNYIRLELPELRTGVVFEEPERAFPAPYGFCSNVWKVQGADGSAYNQIQAGIEQFYVEKNMRLNVNSQELPLPDAPSAIEHLKIERIDVNDVLVTDEAGNTSYVPGTYQVFPIHQDGVTRLQPLKLRAARNNNDCLGSEKDRFNTKSGLDVLPGLYHVVVDFKTALGPQSKVYVVDLR